MEDFKTESRYLKLCYVLEAIIRYMNATFCRPDFQKFLMCPSNKRLGRAFVFKDSTKPLKP